MTTLLDQWKFKSQNVDPAVNEKQFVSSASVVFCSIPAAEESNLTDPSKWIPIGLVENASMQQRKTMSELFEIGSKKQFQIPGRDFRRVNMSRILFDGGSLLKVLTGSSDTTGNIGETSEAVAASTTSDFFINLASSYFDIPRDIGFVLKDQDDNFVGCLAMKGCYIESHQMSVSANQTVIMESVSMIVNDFVPVATVIG